MKKLMLLAIAFILVAGCNKDNSETEILTVASETRTCYMVAETTCYVVKYGNSGEWQLFYNAIQGFNHEPGYEYVIKVEKKKKKEILVDDLGYVYSLIEIISKEKKDSEIQFRCTGRD